ncbi:hypothetical protein RR46_03320 [Papilio xuthus]|uniref:Uncharacterized protein n=1 Tax=Papilio xuthus TaxID=66420 RepID=A0A194Q954_PAPXU|nr:hypothetical protein RR46_03320 [Papilio xuthus]
MLADTLVMDFAFDTSRRIFSSTFEDHTAITENLVHSAKCKKLEVTNKCNQLTRQNGSLGHEIKKAARGAARVAPAARAHSTLREPRRAGRPDTRPTSPTNFARDVATLTAATDPLLKPATRS